MTQNKYKIKFEELESFVIKTIRDPFLLMNDEWLREKEWLVKSYLSEKRNYAKNTIINGEELGIIIFKQKKLNKEDVFIFNESQSFQKAIKILKDRISNFIESSIKEIFDLVKGLEVKPCDQ